jgi:DNA invertase Pin-like site-specific DNA recombinase
MVSTNVAVIYVRSSVRSEHENLIEQIRTGLECLSKTDPGACDVIVMADSSRLGRNQSELTRIIASAANRGVRVLFADGVSDSDSKSATGE